MSSPPFAGRRFEDHNEWRKGRHLFLDPGRPESVESRCGAVTLEIRGRVLACRITSSGWADRPQAAGNRIRSARKRVSSRPWI
jgi:hypothetical protein